MSVIDEPNTMLVKAVSARFAKIVGHGAAGRELRNREP